MRFDWPILLRLANWLGTLLGLLLLGLLLRPVEAPAWRAIQATQPELNLAGVEDALGQGLVLGLLGGFRAITADLLWIQTNVIWEQRDRAKLDPMIRLVTTLDPRPDFFWINAARMTAYDVPNWRIREEGGHRVVPEVRQMAIDREQAEQAFLLLERALQYHSDNPKLYLEIGQIHLHRLKDPTAAAPWFLKAWQQPGAPYFSARIYAELLRRQGMNAEAYAFLKQLHGELPDDEPRAQKGVVLERIRELENSLEIPVWDRYRP